jgi:hypothetical protein
VGQALPGFPEVVIRATFNGEFEFRGPRAYGLRRMKENREIVIRSTKLGRTWVGIGSMWGLAGWFWRSRGVLFDGVQEFPGPRGPRCRNVFEIGKVMKL